ncbi:MAG TPA: hypothetical protein VKD24_10120 [Candidatus Angelobacter sp.]|nr:hypothetical protein [Candidatus Angelobacter sp.]
MSFLVGRALAAAREGLENQILNLVPHRRVAIHSRVTLPKKLLVPCEVGNIDSAVVIVKLEIAEDFCCSWIFCPYVPGTMDEDSIALEKACGGGNVRWDHLIVQADRIYLDSEQDRNAGGFQLPRKLDHRGATETLSVDNQAPGCTLFGFDLAVAAGTESPLHQLESLLSPGVLKGSHLYAGQVHVSQLLREAANSEADVVTMIAAAHEAQDEYVLGRGHGACAIDILSAVNPTERQRG